ncbi:MAG: hypothetical protein AABY22_10020 [Nanoarchaeota archaeon]
MEINENSEKRYYHGKINFLIRLYYYMQEGAGQFANIKNVAIMLLPLAVYAGIREDDLMPIVLIGLASIPVLILIGWLWVMRARKSTEYFSVKYTSPFGKYGIELQEKQVELLEEILKRIPKNEDTFN